MDWAAVWGLIPNMLTLLVVTLLCIVMYVGGLELAANRDLDWNREFRLVGLAAFVAGLGGGPPGCQVVPTSMRSLMFGVDMRFTGVVAALVIGSTLLLGDAVLKHVPVPLMGGVLLFTGMVMVEEWLVKIKRRVPGTDYAIIVAMFLTITILGFFEGVGIGMLITIIFFVVRLSRLDVIESRYTARERRSKRSRPIPHRAILQAEGFASTGLPATGIPILRQRLSPGGPSEGVLECRTETEVHSARFRSRFRHRLLGRQCAVQIHARRPERGNARGAVRRERAVAGRAQTQSPGTGLRQRALRRRCGSRPRKMRGHAHRRLPGRGRYGGRIA